MDKFSDLKNQILGNAEPSLSQEEKKQPKGFFQQKYDEMHEEKRRSKERLQNARLRALKNKLEASKFIIIFHSSYIKMKHSIVLKNTS